MNDTIRPVTEVLQWIPSPEPQMPHYMESHDIDNFEHYYYGDEELEKFFENYLSFDQAPTEPSPQSRKTLV